MIKWLERLIYGELPPAHKVAEQEAIAKMKDHAAKQDRVEYDARRNMYVRPKKARTERDVVLAESRRRSNRDSHDSSWIINSIAAADSSSYTSSSSSSSSCSRSSSDSSSSSSSDSSSSSSSSSDSGSSSSGGCD